VLHTFISGNHGDHFKISRNLNSKFNIECSFDLSQGSVGQASLNLTPLSDNKEKVSGGGFEGVYDIVAQTLTDIKHAPCLIPDGSVFTLNK